EQFPHQLPGDHSLRRDSLALLLVPPGNPMRLRRDGDQWVGVEQTLQDRRSRAGTAHDEDERIGRYFLHGRHRLRGAKCFPALRLWTTESQTPFTCSPAVEDRPGMARG